MSASWHSDRSADGLVSWFGAGGDGARRSSKPARANGRSFHDIARGSGTQTAFATLGLGHNPRHRYTRACLNTNLSHQFP